MNEKSKIPHLKKAAGLAAVAAGLWLAVSPPSCDAQQEQTRGAVEDVIDGEASDAGTDASDAEETDADATTLMEEPDSGTQAKKADSLTQEEIDDKELARKALNGDYESARTLVSIIRDGFEQLIISKNISAQYLLDAEATMAKRMDKMGVSADIVRKMSVATSFRGTYEKLSASDFVESAEDFNQNHTFVKKDDALKAYTDDIYKRLVSKLFDMPPTIRLVLNSQGSMQVRCRTLLEK